MKNNSYSDDGLLDKYLKEIGKINLLTHEEEIELSKGNYILTDKEKKKLNEIIIKEESNSLVKVEKLTDAQKALVSANLRLVVSIAKDFRKYLRGSNPSFFDLILEGNVGLIKMAQKFDYLKGVRFSTYAGWWIRQAISRVVHYKSRTIHIPTKQLRRLYERRASAKKQRNKLGNSPEDEEITAESGSTVRDMEKELPLRVLSLQYPVGDNRDSPLGDFIEDPNLASAEDMAGESELVEKIRRILSGNELTPREEKIIRLRYGIGEESDHTLEEVGKRFGMSRERIRQIEARAFGKLKKNKELKAF